jgi:hypothetical protein
MAYTGRCFITTVFQLCCRIQEGQKKNQLELELNETYKFTFYASDVTYWAKTKKFSYLLLQIVVQKYKLRKQLTYKLMPCHQNAGKNLDGDN